MKKIVIDDTKCISCGLCITIAPDVFELLPGETAKVKETANLEVDQTKIDQAIAECPVQAISWGKEEVVVDGNIIEPADKQTPVESIMSVPEIEEEPEDLDIAA